MSHHLSGRKIDSSVKKQEHHLTPGEVIECEGANPCPLRNACRLRGLLREAQESFFAVLDPWTIDDLAQAPTASVLLSLGVRPPD